MQKNTNEQLRPQIPEQPSQETIDFFDVEHPSAKQELHESSEAVEQQPHTQDYPSVDSTISTLKHSLRLSKKQKPHHMPQIRDEMTLEIEQVLEEGLGDAFRALTPVQQQEFKIKGEQVAYDIRHMFTQQRLKVRTLLRTILEWLKLLPGINRFFLQQEAKIKVDKLVALHKHKYPH